MPSPVDIHDAAILRAALAVLGTITTYNKLMGNAIEALNLALIDVQQRIESSHK